MAFITIPENCVPGVWQGTASGTEPYSLLEGKEGMDPHIVVPTQTSYHVAVSIRLSVPEALELYMASSLNRGTPTRPPHAIALPVETPKRYPTFWETPA